MKKIVTCLSVSLFALLLWTQSVEGQLGVLKKKAAPKVLDPKGLDLDLVGEFAPAWSFRVVKIVDEQTAVVAPTIPATAKTRAVVAPSLVVRGVATRGWVTAKIVKLPGPFKVEGTEKHGVSVVYSLRAVEQQK